MSDDILDDAIAIIGLATRFPGDHDAESLWPLLMSGATTETRFSVSELDPSLDRAVVSAPNYVPVRGVVPTAEWFDPVRFEFTPREAQILDPQQRVFLELALHAFEDAGYAGEPQGNPTGVFAGLSNITYYARHLARRPDVLARVGEMNAMMSNEKDYLATRVAHKLNLTGPCLTVVTACSTACVAIAQAFYALQTYQCDLALAGAISVTTPQNRGYLFEEGSILSPDGFCRPFDASARGTYFSNGGGAVLLKRLADALADRDHIRAIVRAAGVNNDGAKRASFAAPGVEGQAGAISQALANADLSATDIGYVEAHGTATPMGDPIEIQGLTTAYRPYSGATGWCPIGSIKGNIGHLDVASGMAGLAKIIKIFEHDSIPPVAHFERANPHLGLENTPFVVNNKPLPWPRGRTPRIAGISSFGSGGTNAHLIIQEPPAPARERVPQAAPGMVVLSASSQAALRQNLTALSDHLERHSDAPLDRVALTLRHGRARQRYGFATQAADTAGLVAALRARSDSAAPFFESGPAVSGNVAWVFPGQGAQYAGMGRILCSDNPHFRRHLETVAGAFSAHLGTDLLSVMLDAEQGELLTQTRFTQPALFAIGVALARLMEDADIRPTMLLGHSIGEYACAHLAGVFDLQTAAAAVSKRAALMQAMPAGVMLAVLASADDVAPHVTDGCAVAVYNTPDSCVVSGPAAAVSELQAKLTDHGMNAKRLRTSHAFHCSMMAPAAEELQRFMSGVRMSRPSLPIVSTVTGTWMTPEEATSPAYWGQQIVRPVKFSQAAQFALAQGPGVFIEAGPGSSAVNFIRRQIEDRRRHGTLSMLEPGRERGAADVAADLWCLGRVLEPAEESFARIPLPPTQFERQHLWFEAIGEAPQHPGQTAGATGQDSGPAAADPAARLRALIAEVIGEDPAAVTPETDLFDLGFDSLLFTQLSISLRTEFAAEIPFRQIMDEFSSVALLTEQVQRAASAMAPLNVVQLDTTVNRKAPPATPRDASDNQPAPASRARGAAISRHRATLEPRVADAIRLEIKRYNELTASSKANTQQHRGVLADPRTASGFDPVFKEAVYPIVTDRSEGAYLWDIDGNRYIDFTCGFGPIMLGHNPPFLRDALIEQLQRGVETGPQSPLAYEVALLVSEIANVERVGFASTGTEAVIAATRLARTVSGREKIVSFAGSYHGIHDEVTVNSRILGQARPGAPGIPQGNTANVIVTPYDDPASLSTIAQRAHEIAAVLVEPVQSRHPDLQPRQFLHALRDVTAKAGIALIFDEIVTGFRVALGGAQAYFGVPADIVTFGKVIANGHPLGVVAGKSRYLDALDGGAWQFGDDSVPEAGVTFFAGTFVRHPLALAAAKATLTHLRAAGEPLYQRLHARMSDLCATLRHIVDELGVSVRIEHCTSWLTLDVDAGPCTPWFYVAMRRRGIFIWEGRVVFLATAHSDADIEAFAGAFREVLTEMRAVGAFATRQPATSAPPTDRNQPPVPGARLGKDPQGRPGWYIEDADKPGSYKLLALVEEK